MDNLDDEKAESMKSSDFTMNISIEDAKLSVVLIHNSDKAMFHHSFSAEELQQCGFNKKQSSKFESVKKLMETAHAKGNGFECSLKRSILRNTEGDCMPIPCITLLITRDDDMCPIEIEMRLMRKKRDAMDALKDHIYDLKRENKILKQRLDKTEQVQLFLDESHCV